jgi:hypothetical protein
MMLLQRGNVPPPETSARDIMCATAPSADAGTTEFGAAKVGFQIGPQNMAGVDDATTPKSLTLPTAKAAPRDVPPKFPREKSRLGNVEVPSARV